MGGIEILLLVWEFVAVVVVATVGVAYLRSKVARQNALELEHLSDTRGAIIEDMRQDIIDLQAQLTEIKAHVHYLEQQNTERIAKATAAEVVLQLRPFLQRT